LLLSHKVEIERMCFPEKATKRIGARVDAKLSQLNTIALHRFFNFFWMLQGPEGWSKNSCPVRMNTGQ
jgi:hypothetical protein